MDVEFIQGMKAFPGWGEFNRLLSTYPAPETFIAIARKVLENMEQTEGVFIAKDSLNITNVHILQHILLERWSTDDWRPFNRTEFVKAVQRINSPAFQDLLKMLTGLRKEHPVLKKSETAKRKIRMLTKLWFTALEQRFSVRSGKSEVARAWLIHEQLWPKVHPAAPSRNAFDSIPYAMAMRFLMIHGQAIVSSASQAMSCSELKKSGVLSTFLERYSRPVGEFLIEAPPTSAYPRGFDNRFAKHPVLRIGEDCLISPDSTMLFGALENQVLQRSLDAQGFASSSMAFGAVFEAYGHLLLRTAVVPSTGESFVKPFKYENKKKKVVDSPDGFLLGQFPIVFEFKATRYPQATDENVELSGLWGWFNKLTGENEERGPLAQGSAFFDDVDACFAHQVPQEEMCRALYVIVSYDAPPVGLNCLPLRNELWKKHLAKRGMSLPPSVAALADRTAVISIQDLESLVTVAESEMQQGQPLSMGMLIHDWWKRTCTAPLAPGDSQGNPQLRAGLGDDVLRRYESAREHFFSLHEAAYDACNNIAHELVYGSAP